jgi:pre-mRNA-processing factor 39
LGIIVQAHALPVFALLATFALPPAPPLKTQLTTGDRLFERGAASVGLDFLAHPFWDKYLEFEDRLEAQDKIFAILDRVIKIPMHQYARYFERFRQLAHTRPMGELLPADTLVRFRAEIEADNTGFQVSPKGELEIERELRSKIDSHHLEIFTRTQTETTKRWTYESEIKRPYFHVTELDNQQLANWRKYLDFEESESDYIRTVFLYERCLVTAAFYDEFWFRYARWMSAQDGKQEEVRNIYQRASTLYVPISRPGVRLQYAYFEEMSDRADVARDIHQAILERMPGHVETIVSWANLERRQSGLEAAIEVYKAQIDSPAVDLFAKAAFVAEWADLLLKIRGSVDEARQVFQKNQQWYLQSRHFWAKYLEFEISQPTSEEKESEHYARLKQVHDDMVMKTRMTLATKKELSSYYLMYLQQRGTKVAMKEFLQIDRELNGYVYLFESLIILLTAMIDPPQFNPHTSRLQQPAEPQASHWRMDTQSVTLTRQFSEEEKSSTASTSKRNVRSLPTRKVSFPSFEIPARA